MFKIRQPFFDADSGAPAGGEVVAPVTSNSEPAPVWGMPSANQATSGNPLFQDATPPAPQPEAQVLDFAGRKIEISDPSVLAVLKDVHKDYTTLEGTYTRTNQRVKELETTNQTLLQTMQNIPQTQAQQAQPQQQQPEDLEQLKSDFMEKFYDDPMSAIGQMLDQMYQQKVQPVIEPISQEREWSGKIQELANKYPDDFQSMIQPMQEVLADMPQLAEQGLETIYQIAKRSQQSQPPAQPTPEQLLSDPNFVQRIMQNTDIQSKVVSQYLQQRQGTNEQIPIVMTGPTGGQSPSVPENKPTDVRGGSKAFLRWLGSGGQ